MYTKGDMLYQDYQWEYKAYALMPVPVFDHSYNERDRNNGYKMLHLINCVANMLGYHYSNLIAYHTLEGVIRKHLPNDLDTYAGIAKWFIKNEIKLVKHVGVESYS